MFLFTNILLFCCYIIQFTWWGFENLACLILLGMTSGARTA